MFCDHSGVAHSIVLSNEKNKLKTDGQIGVEPSTNTKNQTNIPPHHLFTHGWVVFYFAFVYYGFTARGKAAGAQGPVAQYTVMAFVLCSQFLTMRAATVSSQLVLPLPIPQSSKP